MEFATINKTWNVIAGAMPLPEKLRTAWVDALAEVGVPSSFRSGDTVISVDDRDMDKGYLLTSGEFSIAKEGSPGLSKEAPELLGELGRLNPLHKRTASVRAISDLQVLLFSWKAVNAALLKRLSEDEYKELSDALQQYAWGHFTE